MSIETMTKLATYTVGSGGVTSVSFSNIPQTYTDLKILVSSRTDRAAINDGYRVRFNGSTTDLTAKQLYGTGSGIASGTDQTIIDGASANTFSNGEVYIPNYTGNAYKSYSADSVMDYNGSTGYGWMVGALWSNTAPITSIQILPDVGPNFVQYATFTLYGIKAMRTVASIQQSTTGGYLYTPLNPLAGIGGYIYGGNEGGASVSSIKKLMFGSETYSLLTSTTPAPIIAHTASANSGVAGYSYGGYFNGATSDQISKLNFASAAVSVLPATITTVTQYGASFSDSGTAGYKASGFNGTSTFLSGVDKLSYSSETKSATGSNMVAVYCVQQSGFSNKGSAGYFSGGYSWSLNFDASVKKYAFSTGTTSTPTSYAAEYNVVSFANEGDAGYSAGGGDDMLTTIAKMPFSTDTMSNTAYTLSAGKDWGFGFSYIGNAGYFALGRSNRTETDKISFSTGVRTTISPTLTTRYAGASISDNGVF